MELGGTPSSLTGSSIDKRRLEGGALLRNLSIFMALFWASSIENTFWMATISEWGSLTCECTVQFAATRSEINHTAMRGDRTPPCMLSQSLYLAFIAQTNCRGFVDNHVEGIYLVKVASCASMSSHVAFLVAFMRLAIDPTMQTTPPLSLYATNLTYFSMRT